MFRPMICVLLWLVSGQVLGQAEPPLPPLPLPLPPPSGPAPPGNYAPIVQQTFEQQPDGQYHWSFAAADGSSHDATGVLVNTGTGSPSIAVQGNYAYQAPEGTFQVAYVADQFGFQPAGPHIHPAVIEAVRRQVEFARSQPPGVYNEAGFPINVGAPLAPIVAAPTAPGPPIY